jgi:hypothetical protein
MRLPLRKRPARLLVGTGFELYDWWGFLARSLAGVINRKT